MLDREVRLQLVEHFVLLPLCRKAITSGLEVLTKDKGVAEVAVLMSNR